MFSHHMNDQIHSVSVTHHIPGLLVRSGSQQSLDNLGLAAAAGHDEGRGASLLDTMPHKRGRFAATSLTHCITVYGQIHAPEPDHTLALSTTYFGFCPTLWPPVPTWSLASLSAPAANRAMAISRLPFQLASMRPWGPAFIKGGVAMWAGLTDLYTGLSLWWWRCLSLAINATDANQVYTHFHGRNTRHGEAGGRACEVLAAGKHLGVGCWMGRGKGM